MHRSTPPTTAQALTDYLKHRRSTKDYRNEVSLLVGPPSGRVVGRRAAAPALARVLGELPLRRLSSEDLADWEYARSGALSHNRRRANRFILRNWLRFCIERSWLLDDMLIDFPPLPKQEVRREWLRPRQVAFLLRVAREALDDYLYFAVYAYLQTGVRAEELPSLRTSDLNEVERTLSVRGKGRGDGKIRRIPVSSAFVAAWHAHIEQYAIPPGGFVFFSRQPRLTGGPERDWEWKIDFRAGASTQVFRHIFDDPDDDKSQGRGKITQAIMDARRAGAAPDELPHCKISPLVLRRTFACLALIQNDRDPSAGLSLPRLQVAMGHNDIATTKLYLSDVGDYLAIGRANFDLMSALDVAIEHEKRAAG